MRYEFHPEALDEYQEATLYYAERDPALALRFVEAVEDAIRRILEAPERWRVLEEDVRRCLTRVFPYGVLYTIEGAGRGNTDGRRHRASGLTILSEQASYRPDPLSDLGVLCG